MSRDPDPTARLLARCLAGEVEPAALPDAGDEAAWRGLAVRALRLGAGQLLFWRLGQAHVHLPGDVRSLLEQAYWTTAATNMRLLAELQRIVRGLAAAQVPVILMKGAILSDTVYPSIGTRPMADLDVMVSVGHLGAAERVLGELGYRSGAVDALGHTKEFTERYGGELPFTCCDGQGVCLDLHWRLIHQEGLRDVLAIDDGGVWQRARPVPAFAANTWQLSVEDTILYHPLHLALHHRLDEFRLFLDLDRVVRSAERVDWPVLVARAGEWRTRAITGMALLLARDLLGTPVPDGVLVALCPSRFRQALIRRVVDAPGIAAGAVDVGTKGERLLHLLLADRPADAVRSVWRTAWPDGAWLRSRYGLQGARQVGTYRLKHLARMAGYAVRAVGELARSNG